MILGGFGEQKTKPIQSQSAGEVEPAQTIPKAFGFEAATRSRTASRSGKGDLKKQSQFAGGNKILREIRGIEFQLRQGVMDIEDPRINQGAKQVLDLEFVSHLLGSGGFFEGLFFFGGQALDAGFVHLM